MTQTTTIRCSKCQSELSSEARFCTQCGTPVVQAGGASPKQTMMQNFLLAAIALLLAVMVYQGA